MTRLKKHERRSIEDCLTWWAENHREYYKMEHPRLLERQIKRALEEARRGPLSAPDYCAQRPGLKGRCRGCWFAGNPTMYDSGGCLMRPDADPDERWRAEWRAAQPKEGRVYVACNHWAQVE